MQETELPVVVSAPHPRSLDLIFSDDARARLAANYQIVEADPENISELGHETLSQARYIIGQPPLSAETIGRMPELRCIASTFRSRQQ